MGMAGPRCDGCGGLLLLLLLLLMLLPRSRDLDRPRLRMVVVVVFAACVAIDALLTGRLPPLLRLRLPLPTWLPLLLSPPPTDVEDDVSNNQF